MIIEIILTSALLCIDSVCDNVLVGKDTPVGDFVLIQRLVTDPLYKGSVIQFKETDDKVYAIHRIWLGRPNENREKRLQSSNVKSRFITSGCVNVSDVLYEKLLDCCQNEKITIRY